MDIDFRKAIFACTESCVFMAHPDLSIHRIRLSGIDEVVVDKLEERLPPTGQELFETTNKT
jgi:hypothetical protein